MTYLLFVVVVYFALLFDGVVLIVIVSLVLIRYCLLTNLLIAFVC